MVTEQVSDRLVHAPVHPPKELPELGVAVSVTTVPALKVAEQRPGQSIGPGDDATAPLPVPAIPTESANVCGSRLNVAVTFRAALIVTVQVLVPVQDAPLHPANVLPFAAVAVSVTLVPDG
jgi:hypothetical protein